MRGLSPQAESAVMAAIDAAADLVEAGEHPTAALIKAAQQHGLEPGHARLAAVAYNTGCADYERNTSRDTVAKIADFDLADPDVVAAGLARAVKRAAEAAVEQPVSGEYSRPPTFLTEQYRKEAAENFVLEPLAKQPTPPMPAFSSEPMRDCSSIRAQQRKVSEARGLLDKLTRTLDHTLDGLVSSFRTLGGPTVATLQKCAEVRADQNSRAVLAEVVRRCPMLGKTAASSSPTLTAAEISLYDRVAACGKQAAEVVSANNGVRRLEETTAAKIAGIAEKYQPPPDQTDPFHDIHAATKTAASLSRLAAPFIGGMMGASNAGNDAIDPNVHAYMLALDDPAHEQRLTGIKARATVEQLMTQDPVLKGYPQEAVVNAYNQLAQAAPSAATQPLYMQAMLRRYLGQGNALDPDDIRSNVMGPESELAKRRLTAPPALPEVHRYSGGGHRQQAVRNVMEAIGAPAASPMSAPDALRDIRTQLTGS
jgi:hypothetical protein